MSRETTSRSRQWPRAALPRLRHALAGMLVLALFGVGASAASAATVRVVSKTKSGPNIYPTIQGAVNAAAPSDWVLIEPGVYEESVLVEKPANRRENSRLSNAKNFLLSGDLAASVPCRRRSGLR